MPGERPCRQRKKIGPLSYFQLPSFPLLHGFFCRVGGKSGHPYSSLNTAFKTEDPMAPANRDLLFESTGVAGSKIAILSPVHGQEVRFADDPEEFENGPVVFIGVDAAFTKLRDLFFLMSAADCLVLLATDQDGSFAGILHLGWRNLVENFCEKAFESLSDRYGVDMDTIRLAVGPCIYPCCYVFEDPVQKDDPFWEPFLQSKGGNRYAIDLVSALKAQLLRIGLKEKNIDELNICTGCRNDLFFSCYKEGYVSGRFPTIVGFRTGHRWPAEGESE